MVNKKKKQGKKGFISGEQRNKCQILRGIWEQIRYLRTGNLRKQIFDTLGTWEQANLFKGNKGTGTLPGRVSRIMIMSLEWFNFTIMRRLWVDCHNKLANTCSNCIFVK